MDLTSLLRDNFGFDDFRPGQREVIEALDQDRAALAVFPTGGGKSICYQLTALRYEGVTVVVSPLIALMKDQIDFLTARGIGAARLDSSVSFAEQDETVRRLKSGDARLLYVAPERFNNERFLSLLRKLRISLFAVDEAHCISEWGHNFRPDYLKLAETARDLNAERVLALTATATPMVAKDICNAFRIPDRAAIVTGFYRPNLDIVVTPVEGGIETRAGRLIERIRSRRPGPTIVYVTLQKTAEQVAARLESAGLSARAYHAGMDGDQRAAVQDWWMQSGDAIVVATIAFGMGIDKADVRFIYHYSLPKSLESYSQEIGRAGRDGRRAIVELFVCADDVPTLENFAYGDTPTEEALASFCREVLDGSEEFDVNLIELSNRHDIRPLVLRTALTYLELDGTLRQGTPFYAGYEVKLLKPLDEIVSHFQGEPARLVEDVFGNAKKGRIWYSLNPETVAEALGKERRRIVRCLEYLDEHGWAEIRASDARMRYTRLRPMDADATAAELAKRFERRERQEVARVRDVYAMVTSAPCITNALAAHFGEQREAPCGHCTPCRSGAADSVASIPLPTEMPGDFPHDEWRAARSQNAPALDHPRLAARFLCGITSPSLTHARLSRHPLFGSLASTPFGVVMEYCA